MFASKLSLFLIDSSNRVKKGGVFPFVSKIACIENDLSLSVFTLTLRRKTFILMFLLSRLASMSTPTLGMCRVLAMCHWLMVASLKASNKATIQLIVIMDEQS